MRKIILVSHGLLAEGMKNSIELISGKHENLYSFGLNEGGSPKDIEKKISEIIEKDKESEYIIISDFPGGSVNTAMVPLIEIENVFLISGMNLILCLEILLAEESASIDQVIEESLASAKKTLSNINNILNYKDDEEEYFND